MGKIRIRIPTPDNSFIKFDSDIVSADVPMLIGLDILDRESLVPNNVINELQSHVQGWSIPIIRKLGHLYIAWGEDEILFTQSELRKLHRHFHHPSGTKLLNLIRRSGLADVDEKMKKMLSDISKSCNTCQKHSIPPQRFKVSLPAEQISFNK